jgi:hypothetical protein
MVPRHGFRAGEPATWHSPMSFALLLVLSPRNALRAGGGRNGQPRPRAGTRGERGRPDATVMRWDDLGKVAEAIRTALGAEDRRQLATMITDG